MGRMDDFSSLAQEALSGDGEQAELRRTELAGLDDDIQCTFNGQGEVLKRVRTVEIPWFDTEGGEFFPTSSIETLPVGCAWVFKCKSYPRRRKRS